MKKKKTIITIGLITVLLCTIRATYAYFTARVEKQGDNTVNVKTESLANATMEMGNKIEASGVLPGYKVVKTVRVTGSGTNSAKPVNAVISLIPNVTDFSNHIEYEVYALDNPNDVNANNICSESKKHIDNNQYYDEMTCNTSNLGEKVASGVFNKRIPVGIDIEVESNTDKTYYILVSYVNDENNPQDQEQGKRFTIDIDFGTELEIVPVLSKQAKIGDYVKMTPASTSYTISKELTGYESDQEINPSELDLWRVINIKENGEIELISENVSSSVVSFSGKNGYVNYIGTLNEIVKQYGNIEYTIGSRHMGYNVQTEYIQDHSKFGTTTPWTSDTYNNDNETLGGGDMLYENDVQLVQNALGSLVAKNNATLNATEYWLASRIYDVYEYNNAHYGWDGRFIDGNGVITHSNFYGCAAGSFIDYIVKKSIRPIVVLDPNVVDNGGSGKNINDPWILN